MTKLSALFALFLVGLSVPAHAQDFTIDSAHSSANWTVTHLMVSKVRGEISGVTGKVHYDAKNVGDTTVEATLDAATVDSHQPKRNDHLKSPDFFDVVKFPTITFKSTHVESAGEGKLKVTGDLTMRGVTKSVVLSVDGPSAPHSDGYGHNKVGATATTTINRQDFGVSWNKTLDSGGVVVSNEVAVTIDLELGTDAAGAKTK